MALNPVQLTTLKNAILADPVMNAFPNNEQGGNNSLAAYLNEPSNPPVMFWNSQARIDAIFDAIDWAKYTPTDVADATALFTNRSLVIQTKQMNLQSMTIGRETLDATKQNIRAGLRDALRQIPAGALGALVDAGSSQALSACLRVGSRAEVILSTSEATTGGVTGKLVGYPTPIDNNDVSAARNS